MKTNGLFFLSLFLLLLACQNETEGPENYDSLDDFYQKKSRAEFFTFDPTTNLIINGKNGSKIVIPANSIVDSDNELVKDEVELELREVLSKSAMVLNNAPTVSIIRGFEPDTSLLESGGALAIQVSRGNEILRFTQPISVELPISAISQNPMRLWEGNRNESGLGNVNWRPVFPDSQAVVNVDITTENFLFDYLPIVLNTQLNWINCDYIFGSGSFETIINAKVIDEPEDLTDLNLFLIFDDINCVTQMWKVDQSFESFEIPIGMQVKVLAIGLTEKSFYYGIEQAEIAVGLVVDVPLEAIDEVELEKQIANLDQR